jgi:hypothetical protein
LKFSTPEGLSVEAEGEASGVPAKPKGALRTLVSAPTPEAASAFLRLLDLTEDQEAVAKRFSSLAPIRLAGTLTFRERSEHGADLVLDGLVQGGRMRAALRFDGGREKWRTEPADISVSTDSQNVERLLSGVLDRPALRPSDAAPVSGRVLLKASGTPANGMLSLASVSSEGLDLDYTGNLRLPADWALEAFGKLRIVAQEARPAFALAGLRLPDGVLGTPIDGMVALSINDSLLSFKAEGLKIGESSVRGVMALDRSPGKTPVLTADLEADAATFSGILAPILGRVAAVQGVGGQPGSPAPAGVPAPPTPVRGGQLAATAAGAADAPSPWPEQAFDLSALGSMEGHIKARFGSLGIEPGLAMGNARLDASFGEHGIRIETLEGDAVGGKLKSKLDIEKTAAGVGLKGSLRIDVASVPGASDAPGDVAAFNIEFSGRALSPAALITDLEGRGEVALGDATLTGLSPIAVASVAEDALSGKGPSGGEALVQALRAALKQGQIRLGKVTIPVVIADGALKLEKVQLEQEEGRATFATAIELGSMKIDSEWQIEPKVVRRASTTGERVVLPAVSVIYVGKLSELSSLEPKVTTGSLERELTVRKMERDVDELERLRKLDQTRSRQQLERQKALDAERAKAAIPAPQPATSPPPPAGAAPAAGAEAPPAAAPDGGVSPQDSAGEPGASTTANAATQPEVPVDGTALPVPAPVPAPASPPRKKKPVEQWRPFEQPTP